MFGEIETINQDPGPSPSDRNRARNSSSRAMASPSPGELRAAIHAGDGPYIAPEFIIETDLFRELAPTLLYRTQRAIDRNDTVSGGTFT
jgi:hypothetical protein